MLRLRGCWVAWAVYFGVRERCFIPTPRSSSSLRSSWGSRPARCASPRSRPLPTSRACCSFPSPYARDYRPTSGPSCPRHSMGVRGRRRLPHRVGHAARAGLALRRKVEALGLGVDRARARPVANLLFPSGVLIAERTLYLPSVGLALAAGRWLEVPAAALGLLVGVVAGWGGAHGCAVPCGGATSTSPEHLPRFAPLVRRPMATAAIYFDQGTGGKALRGDPDRLLDLSAGCAAIPHAGARGAQARAPGPRRLAPVARGSRLHPCQGLYWTRKVAMARRLGDTTVAALPRRPRAAVARGREMGAPGFHDGTSLALSGGRKACRNRDRRRGAGSMGACGIAI